MFNFSATKSHTSETLECLQSKLYQVIATKTCEFHGGRQHLQGD